MRILIISLLSLVITHINALERKSYTFSHDPIDVVIVAHQKDCATLDLAIEGIEKYIPHRNIIVVSQEKLTDKASWFDETHFPFTKEQVALTIFNGDIEQTKFFINHPKTRIGWIYQQLCKLYALFIIPNISENILVVDADTIFLRPVTFQTDTGAPLFNVGTEYNRPYFEHMHRVIPGLKKVHNDKSGITHHMLFQKCIMLDLFDTIRQIHHEEPWQALCRYIDHGTLYGSGISEYELYFNFACMRTDQIIIRPLQWTNVPLRDFGSVFMHNKNLHYVSCHSYL